MRYLKNILFSILSLFIFLYVIFFIEAPSSWQTSTIPQILLFFLPLTAFLAFTINIFLNYLPRSFGISFGLILLLVLKAVDLLNIYTIPPIVIFATILFILIKKPPKRWRFKKPSEKEINIEKSLTNKPKVPTLSPVKKFK